MGAHLAERGGGEKRNLKLSQTRKQMVKTSFIDGEDKEFLFLQK